MKKKFIAVLILCIVLAFGMVACGDKSDKGGEGTAPDTDSKYYEEKYGSESAQQKEVFPQFDEKTRVYKTGYGIDEKFSFVLPEGWEVTLDVFPQKGKDVFIYNAEDFGVTMQRLNTALDELVAREEAGQYITYGTNEYYQFKDKSEGGYYWLEFPSGVVFEFATTFAAEDNADIKKILETFIADA